VAAAHAACLRCVAVPNPHADRARFAGADLLLTSAEERTLDAILAGAQPATKRRRDSSM
jgi:hypothetical protein